MKLDEKAKSTYSSLWIKSWGDVKGNTLAWLVRYNFRKTVQENFFNQ